jgi:serine/threonine-protein kinase
LSSNPAPEEWIPQLPPPGTFANWQSVPPEAPFPPASFGGPPIAAFGAPLATWAQRVGAGLLDALVLGLPLVILDLVMASATRTTDVYGIQHVNGGALRSVSVVSFLVGFLYFSCLNGLGRGQTVGNRAPGIAVRDVRSGGPIGFWRGGLRWFVRTALYCAFVVPGVVNDLFPLFDQKRQTLADKCAGSVVVRQA